VEGQVVRPRVGKRLNKSARLVQHQMDIQQEVRHGPDFFDHDGPEREVRHEVAVHDIEVEEIGPGVLDPGDLIGQVGEIRRQNRRGNRRSRQV